MALPKRTTWEQMAVALADLKRAKEDQDEILRRVNALTEGSRANIDGVHVHLFGDDGLVSLDVGDGHIFCLNLRQARGLAGWVIKHLGNVHRPLELRPVAQGVQGIQKVENVPNGPPESGPDVELPKAPPPEAPPEPAPESPCTPGS